MKRTCLTFFAVLALLVTPYTARAATGMAAQAAEGQPRCGGVVAQSLRLTHNLSNCPDGGLVVGADGITIDLGGHTLGGDGLGGADGGIGVQVNGHSRVIIRNGSIANFGVGMVVQGGSSHDTISGLTIRDNANKAILLFGDGTTNNTISRDRITGNGEGVGIVFGANDNVVADNVLSRDTVEGIENLFADRTLITRNTFDQTGSGVVLESSNNLRITRNLIRHSIASNCDGCGIGVQIYGNDNLVADNVLLDSPRYGIEVDDFQDPGHSPATGNELARNVVIQSGIGIAIGPEASGVVLDTMIRANVVIAALQDGIQLTGPSTGLETSTLTRNFALRNGDYGIETVPDTIDGGGNRAAGNGNPLQCLNITCR